MRQGLLKIAAGVTSAMISTNIDSTQVYTVVRPLSKSKNQEKFDLYATALEQRATNPAT